LNIYIYGNDDFKEEIDNLLEHSNVKFRLDENSSIIELKNLDELKDAIEENPEDIYLIDDSKIIKKKSINSKFKFLRPKDGIEQEYLLDHGIGDMSVDSLDELTKHIIYKLDNEQNSMIDDGVEESIRDIVDEAYEVSDEDYPELDDELSSLLTHIDPNEDDDMQDFFDKSPKLDDDIIATSSKDYFEDYINEDQKPQTYEDVMTHLEENSLNTQDLGEDELLNALDEHEATEADLSDLDELMNLPEEEIQSDIKDDIISKDKIENIKENISLKGENMANEFSELDSLNENDVLSALEGLSENIEPTNSMPSIEEVKSSPNKTEENNTIKLDSSNSADIVALIQQLLNNKTLEITVKIKD
jgi:predicted small metal-binding protein